MYQFEMSLMYLIISQCWKMPDLFERDDDEENMKQGSLLECLFTKCRKCG